MHMGIIDVEFDYNPQIVCHEMLLKMAVEIPKTGPGGVNDGYFMKRVRNASLMNDPQVMLLMLLEECTGHRWQQVEELPPDQVPETRPSVTRRNINLGD